MTELPDDDALPADGSFEPTKEHAEGDNALVLLNQEGDPLPDVRGSLMIERQAYERVIEGLKMCADACAHLARQEPQHGETWMSIARMLDGIRRQACQLAGLEATSTQRETQGARGNPYGWRRARDRFLDGLKQATGGMRQLATCFRGELQWSIMAQGLERREESFRRLLTGRLPRPTVSPLILPSDFVRH
jgi:hypothetical protein